VLLGAVALGRTAFGVLLVVAYGIGMAGTLTAAGLLLIGVQRRLAARVSTARLAARLTAVAPVLTGLLVLVVGLGLAGRSAAGLV